MSKKFKSDMPIVQKDDAESIIEELKRVSEDYWDDADYLLRATLRQTITMLEAQDILIKSQREAIADLCLENFKLNEALNMSNLR